MVSIPWFHNLKVSNSKKEKSSKLERIGFISRISPEKGLEILLESIVKVNNLLEIDIKLTVAGDMSSDYAKQLMKRFKSLDIEWLGWLEADSLTEVYEKIDMLIVPSISYDNGPITIMEAIATKTPVVVSDNETLTTYLKNIKTLHTFESGSSDDLANLIIQYVKNPHLLNEYISEMPSPVTVDKYVDELIKIYQ